ncbi:MAG: succinate--CoA ligase subunit alpha [Firmicutes bacterium]|nr:succinate--CoA ligase subunit alpha [Bacillota bacterium]MDH7494503.1 succinate--CoA ligase subunit alpha [Bacillota bacterium]
MGIFVGEHTRLVVQGITGREGRFHAGRMKEYGTNVVAGMTPGRGGTDVDGVPVYDTVLEAVKETGANTSCIFVPASAAADAASEALAAGIETVVCITEGIPTLDVMSVLDAAKAQALKGRIIGPNCPGLVTCGKALVGIMPGNIFTPGPVGLISRSGTLTYEVVNLLTSKGIGQSTCIGVGGDPIIGTNFVDCLAEFERDPETRVVVLIGEIGGQDEEDAAAFIKDNVSKPVVAFVSGRTAPPGKRMGHAGAIVSGSMGTAESKVRAFREAGVPVADSIADIADLVAKALGR